MNCPYASDNLLRKLPCSCIKVEDAALLLGFDPQVDEEGYHDGWHDSNDDESQFPINNERHYKGCNKCDCSLKNKAKLLRDSGVNKVAIRRHLHGDRVATAVKEANVLA